MTKKRDKDSIFYFCSDAEENALFESIVNNNCTELQRLIDEGVNLHCFTDFENARTPLDLAYYLNRVKAWKIIKAALDNRVEVAVENDNLK